MGQRVKTSLTAWSEGFGGVARHVNIEEVWGRRSRCIGGKKERTDLGQLTLRNDAPKGSI